MAEIEMRLRIESDGSLAGTIIADAETGKRLDGCVTDIHWHARSGTPHCTATIVVEDVKMVYVGGVRVVDNVTRRVAFG